MTERERETERDRQIQRQRERKREKGRGWRLGEVNKNDRNRQAFRGVVEGCKSKKQQGCI